uniref:Uncharacterized protein n=1 Tax=Anaerolinea thermolimosa TaxID=229919 RepID=A0A7C4PK46_9CHLR
MLDDLRNEASSSFEETTEPSTLEGELSGMATHRQRRRHFLGMTPAQRFVITLLLFMMVCLLGALCLIVFEKVVLPL